jgi:hypothetical protein
MEGNKTQDAARQAVAYWRNKKATDLAFLAWSVGITAEQMGRASVNEWRQLVAAAKLNARHEYGEPSEDTKRMTIVKMVEMERRTLVA